MASGRKLVRDLFFSKQPLFRQFFSSQIETIGRRLYISGSNGCLSSRHYSVLNEFSKTIKNEVSSSKEFQQSLKQLQEKAQQFKRAKDQFEVRMQQATDQLYKHVDGMWTEAGATASKVSTAMADKLSVSSEEAKENFGVGKQESESSGGTSESSSASNSADLKDENKANFSADTQSQLGVTAEFLLDAVKSMSSSVFRKVLLPLEKLKEVKAFELAGKCYEVVKDDLTGKPNRRKRLQYAASSPLTGETSARTELVIVPSKQSVWSKKWEAFKEKMQSHPTVKQIEKMSEPVVTKTQEYVEDLREMWETSDSPIVEKIQNLNDRAFGENAAAMSFKQILQRDPLFSLPEFVAEVEEVIYPVLNAQIKGDFEVLKKYCSPEILERCIAEHKAYESHGIIFDKKILHVSEVDVSETKMMGDTPIIILRFQTQQVHCLRDRLGSVTEGSRDTIHTVHYAWAMQQTEPEAAGKDAIYSMWRLRDMRQYGVVALI